MLPHRSYFDQIAAVHKRKVEVLNKKELLKLQNGTDIRGIALENKERQVNLDKEATEEIAKGFVLWLSEKTHKAVQELRIAVGRDSRLSGDMLKKTMMYKMQGYGVQVFDTGLSTTPAMFMSTVFEDYKMDGAVMITASHLPYFHNGFKFFTREGGLDKADITQILSEEREVSQAEPKDIVSRGLIGDYSRYLVDFIRKQTGEEFPLKSLHIIVDAGNGAGGFFAKEVLEELGADTKGSCYLEPDGMFPNHIPNPENKEAMRSISQAVANHGADLGIIFDTDVDRAAIVSHEAEEINRNRLIALISSIVLAEHPGSTIVTDSITSNSLAEFIEARGGLHHRFKRGYRNVINEAVRLNEEGVETHLAIETSGHAAMKENYFLDDGAYLVAKILVYVAKLHKKGLAVTSLLENLTDPKEEGEYRLPITATNFKAYGQSVLSDLERFIEKEEGYRLPEKNYEGVKGIVPGGWFLLRMSLHEPLMPLNIEGDEEGVVGEVVRKLKLFFEKYEELDSSSLT